MEHYLLQNMAVVAAGSFEAPVAVGFAAGLERLDWGKWMELWDRFDCPQAGTYCHRY